MKKQVTTSPAAQSPVQTETKAMEANNMKKIIVTVSIAFVIALSALVINPNTNFNQSAQAGQTGVKQIDSLLAGGGDNGWNGG